MTTQEARDPFDSLAPAEVELLGTGSVIISGAGVRWRRLPVSPGGSWRDSPTKWWNGFTEVDTATLYGGTEAMGMGEKYWLVTDPTVSEWRCQEPDEPEGGARDDVWTQGCPAAGCVRLWHWDPNPAHRGWIHEGDSE